MWLLLWIFAELTLLNNIYVQGHCTDIHSHIVSQGLHYVPGTDPCILCICDKGSPKWCKSVLCSPPQNCKSFQIGNSCCEFKCLDDILTAHDGYKDSYDVALRFIASAVTAVLSLSLLFFLFHRLRRRKILVHQNQQLNEDQRSLNSIGYITGSLGYLPENMGYLGSGNNELEFRYEESSAHYSLWKPPGNYFPRGEAPPPYEEAVRTAQMENDIINNQIRSATGMCVPQSNNLQNMHRQNQSSTDAMVVQSYVPTRLEPAGNTSAGIGSSPQYANITVQSVSVHNADNSKFDTLNMVVQPKHKTSNVHDKNTSKLRQIDKHEKAYENITITGCSSSGGSSKLSTTKRARPASSGYNKVQKQENTYENCIVDKNNALFNRQENILLDSNNLVDDVCKVRKAERSKENEKNTSDVYEDINVYDNRHRTILNLSEYQAFNIPLIKGQREAGSRHSNRDRKLRLGERSESNLRSLCKLSEIKELPLHRTLPKNLRELIAREVPNEIKIDADNLRRSQSTSYEASLSLNQTKSHSNLLETVKSEKNHEIVTEGIPPNFLSCKNENRESKPRSTNEDEVTFVSYQCLSSSQDDDDYRSECENCKSSGFTIPEDEETDMLNETMTLQRRPLETGEDLSYYRTSLTLPTQTRKPRTVTNSNRENWFTSMQETSSSEESD